MDTAHLKKYTFKDMQVGIEVKDLSFVKNYPKIFAKAHQTDFYQVIFIQSGKAFFKVDFQDVVVDSSEMVMMIPNQACEYDTSGGYSGKIILFTPDFCGVSDNDTAFLHSAEILNPVNANRTVNVDTCFANNIFLLLENELNNPFDAFQPSIARCLLKALLCECERQISSSRLNLSTSLARKFFNLVEEHLTAHKKAEFYIDHLHVSEKKLAAEIRKSCGLTPKGYINSRLLLEAKRLLKYSNLTIKEVAWELGFEDAANFSNWFKKRTRTTPLLFRGQ